MLVRFDPQRWTDEALLAACGQTLGLRPELPEPNGERERSSAVGVRAAPRAGRVRLAIPGLRRAPERERPIEERLGRIAGVQLVRANAWTGNVLVLFDQHACRVEQTHACRVEQLLAACTELGELPAPGRQRWPRPGRRAPAVPPVEPTAESPVAWHALKASAVAQRLGVDPARGLTPPEGERRRGRFGLNRMPEPGEPSLLRLIAHEFTNGPTTLGAGKRVLRVPN